MTTHVSQTGTLLTGIFTALLISGGLLAPADAEAKSKRYTVEAEYCKGETNGQPNPCGALVYADATSNYYVNKVEVNARGTQDWDQNPNCTDLYLDDTMDLRVSEYGVFIVPAPCSYKLTIHIGGGDKKGQHVFVTPGCQAVLESTGTTLNNNTPKVEKIQWTDEAKAALGVSNSDAVDDSRYHAAMAAAGVPGNSGVVHYCNKDDKADKNFN